MKSWRDEDLILFVYDEHPRGEELERDLLDSEAGPALRERLDALRRQLAVFDEPAAPEPRPGLEERVWARLRPQLDSDSEPRTRSGARRLFGRPAPAWGGWRFAAVAAALVLALLGALLGAFVLGRRSVTPSSAVVAARPFSDAARERLLDSSVSGHLESSSLLLTDLSHASPEQQLGDERVWAASLLAENRLYRRAAERAGQRRIVALLDELEPLLVELANLPADPAAGEVTSLQHRIDERDLLFKVRVVGARLRSSTL